jgi:hypothetical protein
MPTQNSNVPFIDEKLLQQYLSMISYIQGDQLSNLMSQFGVIKNLINRKEFALKDHHVLAFHQKFKSLCIHRKNLIFT